MKNSRDVIPKIEEIYNLNEEVDEDIIKNALLNYLDKYKSNNVENLQKNRYSQNGYRRRRIFSIAGHERTYKK